MPGILEVPGVAGVIGAYSLFHNTSTTTVTIPQHKYYRIHYSTTQVLPRPLKPSTTAPTTTTTRSHLQEERERLLEQQHELRRHAPWRRGPAREEEEEEATCMGLRSARKDAFCRERLDRDKERLQRQLQVLVGADSGGGWWWH